MGSVHTRQILVTPEIATAMLAKNTGNYRNLNRRTIDRYARDMEAGAWVLNGEALKFDVLGNLIDGQHRLHAVIQSGRPIESIVVHGLSQSAFLNIDNGKKRSLSDHLRHMGEVSVVTLAASANLGWRYDNGAILTHRAPTITEAMAWISENPSIREDLHPADALNKATGLPGSAYAVLLHVAGRLAPREDVDLFIQNVKTGANLAEDNPCFALRKWATARDKNIGGSKAKSFAVMAKAWNYYITGNPIKILTWKRGGAGQESFPKIVGPDW